MQFAKFVRGALLPMLAFLFICTAPRSTIAEEPYKLQIDSLRKSLEKYQDYQSLCATFTFRLWGACITPARK